MRRPSPAHLHAAHSAQPVASTRLNKAHPPDAGRSRQRWRNNRCRLRLGPKNVHQPCPPSCWPSLLRNLEMLAAGAALAQGDVADALAAARRACAALNADDPKREVMQRYLDDVGQRLESIESVARPRVPQQRRDFVSAPTRRTRGNWHARKRLTPWSPYSQRAGLARRR
jgi:hypothetical protein